MPTIFDYIFFGASGLMYVVGEYKLAFWLCVLTIANNVGAAAKALINPDWYHQKRAEAGLGPDFSGSGIKSLLVTKVIVVSVLLWAAWRAGEKAGYWS